MGWQINEWVFKKAVVLYFPHSKNGNLRAGIFLNTIDKMPLKEA